MDNKLNEKLNSKKKHLLTKNLPTHNSKHTRATHSCHKSHMWDQWKAEARKVKVKLHVDSGASHHVFPASLAKHSASQVFEVTERIGVENAFGNIEYFEQGANIGFAQEGIVIPGANVGLLSAHKMTQETGCSVEIKSDGDMEIQKDGQVLYEVQVEDGTYPVDADILFDARLWSVPICEGEQCPECDATAYAGRRAKPLTEAQQEKVKELHVITGHQSQERMCAGVNSGTWDTSVTCFEINKVMSHWTCLVCARTKYTAIPTGLGSGVRPEKPGHLVSSDFVPVTPMSCFGHIGYFLFRDVASDYEWPYIVKSKDEFKATCEKTSNGRRRDEASEKTTLRGGRYFEKLTHR